MDLVQVLPNALNCPCVSINHALKKQGIKTLKPLISQGFQVSVSILVTQDGKPTARGYNAPCFAGVVHCFMGSGLKRRDNGTSGTKCGVLPRGLLSDAPFSVNRRFPLSKFYPGCLLNTPNKRAKTHACVFNARVRFLFYRAIHGSCAFSHQ